MCKTKMAIDAIQPKTPTSRHRHPKRQPSNSNPPPSSSSVSASASNTKTTHPNTTTTPTNTTSTSSTSHTSRTSLSSLRGSLPENPHLYDISELRKATNNFLINNFTPSSSSLSSSRCWRCNLRGKDAIILQRKSQNIQTLNPQSIRQKLSSICKSHHTAIVNLLGASISGDYIYLVYEFINGGSNLHDLLHYNKNKNSGFTVLNTWISRMQIAADLANGVDYIHNDAGNFVHNHIKSSSVIVTEPCFNAKICHFGTSELCGEPIEDTQVHQFDDNNEIVEEIESVDNEEEKASSSPSSQKFTRSKSVKFNGTTGYMSPEFQITGVGTRKSDVYALGVILVELLSGQEPVKYKYNKATKEYMKISVVDAAKAVVDEGGGGGGGDREGRLRKWIDIRLKDSYPVEVALKMTKLAVDCLHVDPNKRPDMRRVAGKISKLYLESQSWCDKMKIPTEFTVSFAPR